MNNHARQFSIAESPEKGTEVNDPSLFDRLRDALGGYTAHSRLETRRVGRDILDKATVVHLAIRRAFSRRSSTEWSESSGFRSPGDYRKAACAEHPYNETDIATVLVLDPEGYCAMVDELARQGGGRFEPLTAAGKPITQAIALLGKCAAEISSVALLAISPEGEGGATITTAEARALLAAVADVKRQALEIEAALMLAEARK